MHGAHLEAALPAGTDPRRHARVLAAVHEAAVSGGELPARPRAVIGDSWQRMRRLGVDPDHGELIRPLSPEDLEQRRRDSGLTGFLPVLRDGLASIAEESAHIMVITDAQGRLLWRDGAATVRNKADSLGFIEGMCWDEAVVGTNAIGTALVEGRCVQVYSAEHYVRTHHSWTCAAAPLRDPRDGRVLGAVDLSGPASTVHATTLALVDAVGRLAESQLRNAHLAELEQLRSVAVPTLAKVAGPALVTDAYGWVAAAHGLVPGERIALPPETAPGSAMVAKLGRCVLEPLPGGWLIRVAEQDSGQPPTLVNLALRVRGGGTLSVSGGAGAWSAELSPRHAQLLHVLACHPEGRSAAELAVDTFGDPERTVTVRAELSRLRRQLGGLLARRPYRFADDIEVRCTED